MQGLDCVVLSLFFLQVSSDHDSGFGFLEVSHGVSFDLEYPLAWNQLGGRVGFQVFFPGVLSHQRFNLDLCGLEEFLLVWGTHGFIPGAQIRVGVCRLSCE